MTEIYHHFDSKISQNLVDSASIKSTRTGNLGPSGMLQKVRMSGQRSEDGLKVQTRSMVAQFSWCFSFGPN